MYLFDFRGGTVSSVRCFQIVPRFGQYSRPRTLSAGDIGGLVDDGGGRAGDDATNPTLGRLATALKSHMEKVYSSEVLRCLRRRIPVTLPALQNVSTCLESMPTEEVTHFLVRGLLRSISGVYYGRRECVGRQKGMLLDFALGVNHWCGQSLVRFGPGRAGLSWARPSRAEPS